MEQPNNLFHHFESMITAYISLSVRGWKSLPAADIDVMLWDVTAFSHNGIAPPRKEETMALSVWSMFGQVRAANAEVAICI